LPNPSPQVLIFPQWYHRTVPAILEVTTSEPNGKHIWILTYDHNTPRGPQNLIINM
jgi:hypothetical protein